MKTDIFAIQNTCMEVSVSLSCLFVHEPPYQTTVASVLQFHFSPQFFAHEPPYRFPRKSGARSGSPQLTDILFIT